MILVTSDLHLNDNPRDQYRHRFIEWLAKTIEKLKPSELLILGDLTDEKDRHNAWLTNIVADHIHKLASLCPVTILRGNHDCINPNEPFFEFVGKIPNVTFVTHPTEIENELGKCLFLPHTRNHDKDWKSVLKKRYRWIFAHNTFAGAKIGPRTMEGIPPEVFAGQHADLRVISGDIHNPQEFDAITYVGAPYTCNFGDKYNPRILSLNDGKAIKSIAVSGPQKRLLEVKSLTQLKSSVFNEGDMIKVRYTLDSSNYDKWNSIKQEIRKWGEEQYVIDSIQPIIVTSRKPIAKKADNKTDEELLKHFAKRTSLSEKFIVTGLNLMKGG
jgi:predicted phosphodiesterase